MNKYDEQDLKPQIPGNKITGIHLKELRKRVASLIGAVHERLDGMIARFS